jgi:hypothetical protein
LRRMAVRIQLVLFLCKARSWRHVWEGNKRKSRTAKKME